MGQCDSNNTVHREMSDGNNVMVAITQYRYGCAINEVLVISWNWQALGAMAFDIDSSN